MIKILIIFLLLPLVSLAESKSVERLVKFNYTIKNDSDNFLQNVDFYTYAPVSKTAYQNCLSISSNEDYLLTSDELGNQILKFSFKRIAPYQTLVLNISAKVAMLSDPQEVPIEKEQFLKDELFIEVSSKEIRQTLAKITQLETLPKSVYSWMTKTVSKTDYTSKDLGALSALQSKSGDCTEHAYLYAALLRASGTPTQFLSGYYCTENKVLKAHQFHNWNLFFENGSWQLSDTHMKKFKQSQQNFIAFSVKGGRSEKIMKNKHRYLLIGKGVENLKTLMK